MDCKGGGGWHGIRACILPKCNFTKQDITLLLLQQLLQNFTHRYAIPCAGHCTNQTKYSSSLNQPSPRQPREKKTLKLTLQVFWNGSTTSLGMAQSLRKGMQPAVLWLWRTPHIPDALKKYHQLRIFVSLKDFQVCPHLLAWLCAQPAQVAV